MTATRPAPRPALAMPPVPRRLIHTTRRREAIRARRRFVRVWSARADRHTFALTAVTVSAGAMIGAMLTAIATGVVSLY